MSERSIYDMMIEEWGALGCLACIVAFCVQLAFGGVVAYVAYYFIQKVW